MIITDRIPAFNKFQQDDKKIRKIYKEFEPNIKYKTEICKNWTSGQCVYGDSCIFAHGKLELKSNPIQKTKECQNFKQNFYCSYGEKCLFLHKTSEKKPRLPVFVNILFKGILES